MEVSSTFSHPLTIITFEGTFTCCLLLQSNTFQALVGLKRKVVSAPESGGVCFPVSAIAVLEGGDIGKCAI